MRRFVCFALVAILVLSPVGTVTSAPSVHPAPPGAQAASPVVSPFATESSPAGSMSDDLARSVTVANNTTQRLVAGPITAQGYASPRLDFGAAVAMNRESLDDGYELELLTQRIDSASSSEERQAYLQAAIERIERQIETIQRQEQRAIEAYGSGNISDRELVRRLGMIGYRAQLTTETIERLERATGASLGSLTRQADEYVTPTRSALYQSMTGEHDEPMQVHVVGGEQGLVVQFLSQAGGDLQYQREAVRLDHRDGNVSQGFADAQEFLDYTGTRYPYVSQSSGVNIWEFKQGNWFFSTSPDQGSIRLYVDGSLRKVYREYQQLQVSALPMSETTSVTAENVTVTANHTANGGPIKLTVVPEPGENPGSVDVEINGQYVGKTNEDGVLWYVPPAGPHRVTVGTNTGPVNVTVVN